MGWAVKCWWLSRSVRGQDTGEVPTCPWDVFNFWWLLGALEAHQHLESLSACLSRPREEIRDLVSLKTCQIPGARGRVSI